MNPKFSVGEKVKTPDGRVDVILGILTEVTATSTSFLYKVHSSEADPQSGTIIEGVKMCQESELTKAEV